MHAEATLSIQQLGKGTPLLCLHASGASASQWLPLADHLKSQGVPRQLWMPDLPGHGSSADWPAGSAADLATEATRLWTALWALEQPTDILGHGYGAVLALQMALSQPSRVRSLTLLEPALFGILRRHEPWGAAWTEIAEVAEHFSTLITAGLPDAAAQLFCNYWASANVWQTLSEAQKAHALRRLPTMQRQMELMLGAAWGPQEMALLRTVPIQLVCGAQTRAPALRVAQLLALALDRGVLHELPADAHASAASHARALGQLLPVVRPQQACV